jgi:hypothetical protein
MRHCGQRGKKGDFAQFIQLRWQQRLLVTRCWHRPCDAPFIVFCNYPVARMESEGDRPRGS